MSVTIGRASQVNALGARVQSCICRSSCRGRQCWHLTAGLVGHVFVEADRRLGLQVVVGGLRVRIRVLHGGGGKDAATLPSLRLGPVLQVQRPRRASCNGSFHHPDRRYTVRGTALGSSNWHPRVFRNLPVNSPKWGPAHRQQLRPQMSNRCISGLYHLEK